MDDLVSSSSQGAHMRFGLNGRQELGLTAKESWLRRGVAHVGLGPPLAAMWSDNVTEEDEGTSWEARAFSGCHQVSFWLPPGLILFLPTVQHA